VSQASTATTAGAAVALTGVLLVSVLGPALADAWGDGRSSATPDAVGLTTEPLALRREMVPVTLTARPRPEPARTSRARATVRDRRPTAAQRDADLAAWLSRSLPADVPSPTPAQPLPSAPAPAGTSAEVVEADLVVGSFNVLGSSHTRGGARGREPGVARVQGVVQLLAQHALDVVGFQELQADQLRELQRRVPGWSLYPGTAMTAREGENSLGWRAGVWELVRPGTVAVPYFDGRRRRMPVVLLRHRTTGLQAYFVNVHNPADTRSHRGQQRWRDLATATEISLVNQLGATGVPVFLTGDMNERDEYFCALTAGTSMVAARGGSNGPAGCSPRSPRAVDWVFGSAGVRFSGYTEDRGPLVDRTTDHPVVVARATVDSSTFPRALSR
jgi:endonuclease/exonuclease/phosphatase family metal-dependent hydrolase